MILRLQLHTVSAGETLEILEERYGGWTSTEIALYNAIDPDDALKPGLRLKVMRREPLSSR